jgi:hypothetical protein
MPGCLYCPEFALGTAQDDQPTQDQALQPIHMICEEKIGLLAKYSTLTEELFRATTALGDVAGTHGLSYTTRRFAAAQAREDAGRARIAYERHVAEHGC